jgi:hypothetical protein
MNLSCRLQQIRACLMAKARVCLRASNRSSSGVMGLKAPCRELERYWAAFNPATNNRQTSVAHALTLFSGLSIDTKMAAN